MTKEQIIQKLKEIKAYLLTSSGNKEIQQILINRLSDSVSVQNECCKKLVKKFFVPDVETSIDSIISEILKITDTTPITETKEFKDLQAQLTICTNNLNRERQNYQEAEKEKLQQQNLTNLYKAETETLRHEKAAVEAEKLKLLQDLSREVELNADCADEIDELKQEKAAVVRVRDRLAAELAKCKEKKP